VLKGEKRTLVIITFFVKLEFYNQQTIMKCLIWMTILISFASAETIALTGDVNQRKASKIIVSRSKFVFLNFTIEFHYQN
jgi:hypothetical protein